MIMNVESFLIIERFIVTPPKKSAYKYALGFPLSITSTNTQSASTSWALILYSTY